MLKNNEFDVTKDEFAPASPRERGSSVVEPDPLKQPRNHIFKYTKEEDEFIKYWIGIKTYKEIAKELNRTLASIQARAKRLNIKLHERKIYTNEEDNFLKDNYGKISLRKISKILNRDRTSIIKRAGRLGIKLNNANNKYTKKEIETLVRMVDKYYTIGQIAKKLNRSETSIMRRMRLMKIKIKKIRNYSPNKWTEKDKQFLINNINKMSPTIIAKKLGRSYDAVKKQMQRMNLKYQVDSRGRRKWSEKEIKILRECAGKMPIKEAAKKFPDRSLIAIKTKVRKLNINWYQGRLFIQEISDILGINYDCIIKHMNKINYIRRYDRYLTDHEVIQRIAESILNDNVSLGHCKPSIKHLEACARGEFEIRWNDLKKTNIETKEIPIRNASPISLFKETGYTGQGL